jgi:type VI secretion system protein ImpG
MDRQFLNYYERELRYFRELGAEFAEEYPKVAGRLGLEKLECADPYVERLLEGSAFLAARVQYKLDAEFPRFTQQLLETVYPDYLSPTPSMAVVQFNPPPDEGALAAGYKLPRQTVLRSLLGKGDQTACEYRTAHEVTLWPLEVTDAHYHTQDLGTLGLPALPATPAKAAVRIRLRCTLPGMTFDKLPVESLRFYLRGAGSEQLHLYEQLLGRPAAVVVRPAVKPYGDVVPLPATSVRRVGFEQDEALLPPSPRTFEGYRLLREYFAFPERFLFVDVADLARPLANCKTSEIDLIIALRQLNLKLEGGVTATNFALHCAPAINLFPKRTDRIHLSDRFSEHHVVPDRTRPLDFEVYQVNTVTGFGAGSDVQAEFQPFYTARDLDGVAGGAYFSAARIPRTHSKREKSQGPRSLYAGSEIYLSLVDSRGAPYAGSLKQLALTTLCTNRDLPLHMPLGVGPTDFNVDGGPPVRSVRVISGPTPPKPSYAEGDFAWRIISQLSLNYLSLVDADATQGAAAMRDLLKLYVELATDPAQRAASSPVLRQVESLKSVRATPVVRRSPTPGPIALVRGLEVALTFDENAFGGAGVFVLGAVLEWFFARHVSLNSFTETVIRTLDREEIMRWPSRVGRKPTL